jgi:hypothetical protein
MNNLQSKICGIVLSSAIFLSSITAAVAQQNRLTAGEQESFGWLI